MKEFGEALKLIFGKIGDFIDIFDLSFFISGFAIGNAFLLYVILGGVNIQSIASSKSQLFIAILACYVFGLMCFATGRWFRMWLIPLLSPGNRSTSFEAMFINAIKGHGFDSDAPFKQYLENKENGGEWRLYIRLWADVRHNTQLDVSSQILRRYWVMAATYDGMFVAMCIWSALFFYIYGAEIDFIVRDKLALASGISCVFVAILCLREAGRFVKYQVEELVATIASARDSMPLSSQ